jgi:eukaryotic-like serine/threonine-protein kinase
MSHGSTSRTAPGYLGPYRLLNVVHTGHASQIWQAYDDGHERMIGIKSLIDKARKDREHIGYLRQEHTVGVKVAHPRIIETFAFDIERGTPYLAMEWFSSPNMKQRIQQGLEKISHLVPKIIEQAAEGLGYLGHMGWVHRDVKPDNFLVGDDGQVKLIDLGLAVRVRHGMGKWFARKSRIQGTRSYMSPEQIRGAALDQRADLYSFACTIHELLSGKPPFTGTNANDLLNKHLKAAPPSLEGLSENIAPEFAQLIRRCLAKEPAQRFKSVDDFLGHFRTCPVFKIPPRPLDTP